MPEDRHAKAVDSADATGLWAEDIGERRLADVLLDLHVAEELLKTILSLLILSRSSLLSTLLSLELPLLPL